MRILNSFFREKPVPLTYWNKFSSLIKYLFPSLHHISPHPSVLESTGESLNILELKNALKGEILGKWSLDKITLEFLWKKILLEQPKIIIECGSGVSTLMFAVYTRVFYEMNSYLPTIISLEQKPEIKKAIEERLKGIGLKNAVKVVYSQVNDVGNYIGDMRVIKETLGSNKADLVLIDGPFGPPGCRVNTIYTLSKFCKRNTKWFLDDSFRNGELWILRQWDSMPGVQVEGIYPLGKGLGVGEIVDPTAIIENNLRYK